jgi:nucleoid DNA-binding protein
MAVKKKSKVTRKKAATKKKAATRKKATAKKATAKKATTKKVAAKAVATKKSATTPIKTPMTKSQMYTEIAEVTGLSRKEVSAVFDEYSNIINRHIKRNSAGLFKMPGLFKVKVVRKPATKARKGVNPFTGEEMMFKAKPARNVVKILPLKAMKDMV